MKKNNNKLSYYKLNREIYKRNIVRYSWATRDITRIKSKLEENGYKVELITKDRWDEVWFVRDGSFLVLEDTLVVYNNGTRVGDITKSKIIISKEESNLINLLKSEYVYFVSKKTVQFLLFTLILLFFTLYSLLTN